jgi:hypothetical protein
MSSHSEADIARQTSDVRKVPTTGRMHRSNRMLLNGQYLWRWTSEPRQTHRRLFWPGAVTADRSYYTKNAVVRSINQ